MPASSPSCWPRQSRRLARAASRVVVVVDALDEAEDTGLAPSANRLYLPRSLPEGGFFVVTTREEDDYRLDVDNNSEIWIRDQDPANQQDVARYVERFLDAHADSDERSNRRVWGSRGRTASRRSSDARRGTSCTWSTCCPRSRAGS